MIPRGDWLAVYHTLRDLKIQITPRILNQNCKYFNSLVSGPGTSRLELRRRKNRRSKISRWTVPFGYSCSLQYFIYYFIISLSWELFATYCICTRGCNASNSWVSLLYLQLWGIPFLTDVGRPHNIYRLNVHAVNSWPLQLGNPWCSQSPMNPSSSQSVNPS